MTVASARGRPREQGQALDSRRSEPPDPPKSGREEVDGLGSGGPPWPWPAMASYGSPSQARRCWSSFGVAPWGANSSARPPPGHSPRPRAGEPRSRARGRHGGRPRSGSRAARITGPGTVEIAWLEDLSASAWTVGALSDGLGHEVAHLAALGLEATYSGCRPARSGALGLGQTPSTKACGSNATLPLLHHRPSPRTRRTRVRVGHLGEVPVRAARGGPPGPSWSGQYDHHVARPRPIPPRSPAVTSSNWVRSYGDVGRR